MFKPDISNASFITFSKQCESEDQIIANRKLHALSGSSEDSETLNQKLNLLRNLSTKWVGDEGVKDGKKSSSKNHDFDDEDDTKGLNGADLKLKKHTLSSSKSDTKLPKTLKEKKSKEPAKPKVKAKIAAKTAKPKVSKKAEPAKKSTAAPKKIKLRPVKKLVKKSETAVKPKKK